MIPSDPPAVTAAAVWDCAPAVSRRVAAVQAACFAYAAEKWVADGTLRDATDSATGKAERQKRHGALPPDPAQERRAADKHAATVATWTAALEAAYDTRKAACRQAGEAYFAEAAAEGAAVEDAKATWAKVASGAWHAGLNAASAFMNVLELAWKHTDTHGDRAAFAADPELLSVAQNYARGTDGARPTDHLPTKPPGVLPNEAQEEGEDDQPEAALSI